MGSRTEASKHGLRGHLGVSRHVPGEDSEDTWASEDTFPAKTFFGTKTRGRLKTLPERAALAKALPVVMPCTREKTVAEDRSGTGTRLREDTWAGKDTGRSKTGQAKTHVVTKTRGQAKTLPEERSGEDPRLREDTWAGEDTSRIQTSQAKTHVVTRTRGRAKTLPEDMSGEDPRLREDTWAGGKKTCRAKTRVRDKWAGEDGEDTSRIKTGQAKTHVVTKTRGRAKTLPEDMSGEDPRLRKDTWVGEEWRRHFPKKGQAKTRAFAKTRGRAKTLPELRQVRQRPTSSRRHVGGRRHFPKTDRAKTRGFAKTCGWAKTLQEERSGEDPRLCENTWAGEDTSRRRVGRRPASWRRHMGGRRQDMLGEDPRLREDTWAGKDTSRIKTGQVKTHVVTKTRGRAKTLPADRSGKDPRLREDMWVGEDTARRKVRRRPAPLRKHVGGRRHFPKTRRAKTPVLAKTHGRAKTRHVGRRPASSRRHVGRQRHFPN